MFDFICYLFVFIFGFHAGELMLSLRVREAVKRAAGKEGIELVDKPTIRKLIIEKESNQLMLYDFENMAFICQGATIEELAVRAKEYKNIMYAAVLHNQECFFFVDGDVKSKL
jgi:hypothetical protein